MTKPFNLLRNKMSPEAQIRVKAKTRKMLEEMPLQELRQARSLTQEQMAKILHVKQASVSKLERRTDMYISTLRTYVKAMGGNLEIVAQFPEGNVKIARFENLDKDTTPKALGTGTK